MHVASLSKIVTAIAMTRLLGEAGIPPSTPIIDYLPGYWVKGPNVDQITFADLLTHTCGAAPATAADLIHVAGRVIGRRRPGFTPLR